MSSTNTSVGLGYDGAHIASFELDMSSRALRWTAEAEALFGGPPPPRLGALLRLLDVEARRAWRGAVRHAVVTDTVAEASLHLRLGDRPHAVYVRAAIEPQFDGSIHGLVCAEPSAQPAPSCAPSVRRAPHGVLPDPPPRWRDRPAAGGADPVGVLRDALTELEAHTVVDGLEFIVDVADGLPMSDAADPAALYRSLHLLVVEALARFDAGWIHLYVTHDAAANQLVVGVEDCADERSCEAHETHRSQLRATVASFAPAAEFHGEQLATGGERMEIALPWPPSTADDGVAPTQFEPIPDPLDVLVICDRPRTSAVLAQRLAEAGMRCEILHDVVAATRAIATRAHLDAVVAAPSVSGVVIDELMACWAHARPELVFLTTPRLAGPASAALPFPWTAHELDRCLRPKRDDFGMRAQPDAAADDVAPAA